LVTAGRTEEAIDPVRYISNRSSGRMGFALAEEARARGAQVTVVAGVTDVAPPAGVDVVRATSAAEMAAATRRAAKSAEIVIMCAAVSDWTPAAPARHKIKKGRSASRNGEGLTLQLARTEDILARLGRERQSGTLLVGFALETARPLAEGKRKLREKGLDLIVVNGAGASNGPGAERNRVTLIDRRGRIERHPSLLKRDAAAHILDKIETMLPRRAR
jgi:phosphopantothenoylcysteine decarboxylase/phosphopantothenate--cysteine ligase